MTGTVTEVVVIDYDIAPRPVVIEQESLVPAGPQGVQGTAGSGYQHTQSSPLAIWTVPHNLGRRPIVSVTSVGGIEVATPDVNHLSNNTLQIEFDAPFAGFAYLI